jgi:catechol 2,3-dioxygenase-like lactoylglutathione lyase family enzyme
MIQGLRSAIFKVNDLEEAKRWYTQLLGFGPYFDEPFYVGYNVGGFELGLDPDGEGVTVGNNVNVYWGVSDAAAKVEELRSAGIEIDSEPQDVGGGPGHEDDFRRSARVEVGNGECAVNPVEDVERRTKRVVCPARRHVEPVPREHDQIVAIVAGMISEEPVCPPFTEKTIVALAAVDGIVAVILTRCRCHVSAITVERVITLIAVNLVCACSAKEKVVAVAVLSRQATGAVVAMLLSFASVTCTMRFAGSCWPTMPV